jgi:hypothetical protein
MTSQLQVLDVVVNKSFKDHLRQLYNDWLLEGIHALTPGGKLKKPSVTMLGEWILIAWGRISSEPKLAILDVLEQQLIMKLPPMNS